MSGEAIVSTEHILRKVALAYLLHFLDEETNSQRVLMTVQYQGQGHRSIFQF